MKTASNKVLAIVVGAFLFPSIMGYAAIERLPLPSKKEVNCLASVIWHEARGENIEGKMAVAKVVLNRVNDDRYPNSICKVAFQPHQFTDLKVIKYDEKALRIAKAALVTPFYKFGDVKFYHRHDISPYWSKHSDFKKKFRIGNHVFYELKT
jgi:N-acetylmuramoyl-L-alanine amidase